MATSGSERSKASWAQDSPAVLGLIGVIVGAVIGAVPSYLTSERQIEASRDAASTSFLRDKRQVAYAQYMADHQMLRDAEFSLAQAISTAVGEGSKRVSPEVVKNARDVEERYSKLLVSGSSLRLVASPGVAEIAAELNRVHKSIAYRSNLPEHVFNQETPPEVFRVVSGAVKEIDENLFPQFVGAARGDFG